MQHQNHFFSKLNPMLVAVAIAGLSLFVPATLHATPASHFGPLITALEARSAALSNDTGKVATKQKLEISKTLALLPSSDSSSFATDLKTAILITPGLIKAFPADFATPQPGGTTFETVLVGVFIGFDGDISNLVQTAKTFVDGLPASTCRTKAQAVLAQAISKLPPPAVTDLTAYTKALASALKVAVSGQTLALSKACTGAGGGAVNSVAMTMTVNGMPWAAAKGESGAQYTQNTHELIIGGHQNNNNSDVAVVVEGVTGTGAYNANVSGDYTVYAPSSLLYFVNGGQVTVTTFDLAGHKIGGTFSFTAAAGTNQVTATQGVFSTKFLTVQ